jgi:hypothetical protein
MFEETVERFHQLDDGDVRAVVDELVIGFGGVGPAPGVGEGVWNCAWLTCPLGSRKRTL